MRCSRSISNGMNTNTITTPKLLATSILAVFFLLSLSIIRVEAAVNDSSVNLKKDQSTGLFVLTIKDPDGILEFSLIPAGKNPYGGGLSGCKKSFSNDTTSFADPSDFTPVMTASIIDCKNNTTELEIPPPVKGVTNSIAVKKEVPLPPPPPPAPPKEEKKSGPLSAEDIRYPVSELGNCQSETQCRSYCDIVDNAKTCFTFAKKYNLISEEEAKKAADEFLNVKNGPGGCNSGSSCEDYCSNVDRLDQCIAFAEKSGYYSPAELAEAKKFQALVKAGTQFPGGCKDRNTCEIYCGDSNHMEECLDFAGESGFLSKEEIDEARKFTDLMRQGESPGGCNSREQCENYCALENHVRECIDFALKAGAISPEDAAIVKKTGGKGPGDCRSKAQCDAYCETNSEQCFNWAKENGLISEADLKKMGEGMKRFRENLDKMPPEAVQCLKDALGEENFNKIVSGEPLFDRKMEGKMKSCFSQVTAQFSQQLSQLPPEAAACIKAAVGEDGFQKLQSGELDEDFDFEPLEACFQKLQGSFGGGSNFGDGGFSGPGGCKNTEECTAYCQEHPNECKGFGPPGGGPGDGFPGGGATGGGFPGGGATGSDFPGGPGGCKSQEECQVYCKVHPQECGGGGGTLPPPVPSPTPTPPPTSSCVPPPSGLASWWSADLASGTTVPDISDGNNGTISGGVTIVPMEVGSAFEFNGSSGYISMGNPPNLNFGTEGAFSLEAWFNWDGGGANVNNIIRKSNYGGGPGSGYWLRILGYNKTLEFFTGETVGLAGYSSGRATTPISANNWYHAVATRESSGIMKLYLGGELKDTAQAPKADTTSESPFQLGAWNGGSEFFNGMIDEVSIYARALSASEVLALFDSGSVGKCATSYGRTNREPYQEPTMPPPSSVNIPVPTYSGPGGCKNSEECQAYCTQNYQDPACQQFAPSPTSSVNLESLLANLLTPFIKLLNR